MKFLPAKDGKGNNFTLSESGSVDGKLILDQKFDGIDNTQADGIIYIISGAGGASLYNPELSDNPDLWKKESGENWKPYTARLVSDRHSFTIIETEGKNLILKQYDENGNVFDEVKVTK